MASLLDLPSWRLGTGDLIQQLALLVWLNKEEDGEDLYRLVTTARVGYEVYNRLTKAGQEEALQAECIMNIVTYIKQNPRSSESDLAKEVQKEIEEFKQKVELL